MVVGKTRPPFLGSGHPDLYSQENYSVKNILGLRSMGSELFQGAIFFDFGIKNGMHEAGSCFS
jgi:hypothetical protein